MPQTQAPNDAGREPVRSQALVAIGALTARGALARGAPVERAPASVTATACAAQSEPVPVAGIAPLTTIDFPGALSAILFLQGCPWRCPYCHNAALQPMESAKPLIPWSRVRKFFEERKCLLDAVVFSGGEATIHPRLKDAMREARSCGYKIGLHTNGAFPARVKELLAEGLLDWVGLDMKAPRWLYAPMTGSEATGGAAWETLRVLLASGVPFEIRATLYRPVLDDYEVLRLAAELREAGARQLKLQSWRPAAAPGEIVLEENLTALQSEVDDILRGAAQFSFTERVMEGDESLTTPMPPAALPAATATPAA